MPTRSWAPDPRVHARVATEAAGFFRARPGLDAPEIEFHFAPPLFFHESLTAPSDRGTASARSCSTPPAAGG
ncbi:MAG TPA: hypothetical protein VLW51_04130 [Solirubrobacteraceae bacterium]|nr:hypothetical protein [Solirubrobacteraceae bacterium]